MARRILIVEDDDAVRRSLSETLAEEGYEVFAAGDAEAALSRLAQTAADVVSKIHPRSRSSARPEPT